MIASRVGAAMGLSTSSFPKEELFWGLRKLSEHLASDQPLVLVLDDIQWADQTLLEAIVDLASRVGNAAVLLLCMARPELEEEREGWADDAPVRVMLRLEALSDEDAGSIVRGILGDTGIPAETIDRLIQVSGGNPLFLEQISRALGRRRHVCWRRSARGAGGGHRGAPDPFLDPGAPRRPARRTHRVRTSRARARCGDRPDLLPWSSGGTVTRGTAAERRPESRDDHEEAARPPRRRRVHRRRDVFVRSPLSARCDLRRDAQAIQGAAS